MSAQTYTITQSTFEAEVWENIPSGTNPTATLVISPIEGYTISSGNFSIGNALPSEVASAVFSQDGDNVNCLVTFDASFTMPANNVELLIDIDGTANLNQYPISGTYLSTETNTTTLSTITPFSASGNIGDKITLFTRTFAAAPGYYFKTLPYAYQSLTERNADDPYEISYSDNALGATVTTRVFTVKYTIQNEESITLNDLNFVANAEEIYIDQVEVRGYSINLAKFQSIGATRQITFLGTAGADVTITTTHPYPVLSYASNNNIQTLTLNDSGRASMNIIIPENTTGSNQTWIFTLTGDLSASFSQANPLSIIQAS